VYTGDSLTGLSQSFASKNVLGTNASTLNANYTLSDGNGGNNYAVTLATAAGTITPLGITGSITAANKTYDATTAATITSRTLSGAILGDTVSYSGGTATFDTKDVGTGKAVTGTGLGLAGTDAGNYTVNSTATTLANITALGITGSITGSITAANKTYDGTTAATITSRTLAGVLGTDVVSYTGGTATFDTRNVGTGKTVTGTGLGLTGASAGNYTVNSTATTTANITPLASVAWTGGVTGNWSQASNWAGGALPDGSNVLAVTIPSGSTVTYDPGTTTANTTLNTLISSGALTLAGGTGSILTVNSQLTTPQFTMTSGSLTGTGNLTVSNNYSQSGGTIALTGTAKADITQTAGNLLVGSLAAPSVTLAAQAGAISQSAPIVASNLITQSVTGATLTDVGNKIASFAATNSGSGNVALTNTGVLSIGSISDTNGNITIDNTGAVTTVGAVSAPAGAVSIVAHSPLTIGTGGVLAGGNITLTAGGTSVLTDNLTLNGVVQTTGSASSIALSAGGSVMSGAGFSGANLIGGKATIAAGGNANLSTQVKLLDTAGIKGTFSIFDQLTGNVLTNAPNVPAAAPPPTTTETSTTTTAPAINQVLSTVVTTTLQQPMQTAVQTQPPPVTTAFSGSSPTLLSNSTQTTGGTADTFGGSSSGTSSSGTSSSGTSSSSTSSSSQSDKPADDKSAKKDDKKDDKKGEGTSAKKDEGKPAAKKLATCS
jgi:hypothetical protein